MNILDLLQECSINPKKKTSCHGGEYCSPCPFCKDGDDRFVTWPNQHNNNGDYRGGRYHCRVCGKSGDAIMFLKVLYGYSFTEACKKLRIQPIGRSNFIKREPELKEAKEPSNLWLEKADKFVEYCNKELINNANALKLVSNRGVTLETIAKFKLGYNPCNCWRNREDWGLEPEQKNDASPKKLWIPSGIVIPTISKDGKIKKIKIRRNTEEVINSKNLENIKLPKYVEISGSKQTLSIFGNPSTETALILESELDAILIQQFASELCFCVALGGSTKPLDLNTNSLLRNTPKLFFCPDFDNAGAVAWSKWKKMFPQIRRILTPLSKSFGDAFKEGLNIREFLEHSFNK